MVWLIATNFCYSKFLFIRYNDLKLIRWRVHEKISCIHLLTPYIITQSGYVAQTTKSRRYWCIIHITLMNFNWHICRKQTINVKYCVYKMFKLKGIKFPDLLNVTCSSEIIICYCFTTKRYLSFYVVCRIHEV